MTNFRISGLAADSFTALFALNDTELAALGARRVLADAKPGFPCRVSLEDAEVGERVILAPYHHQQGIGPYQASGPIFVRENARPAELDVNQVPTAVRGRLLSVRAYDAEGWMVGAEIVEGLELESQIERFLSDPGVAYLHLHNARPGCYSCRVDRQLERASEGTG